MLAEVAVTPSFAVRNTAGQPCNHTHGVHEATCHQLYIRFVHIVQAAVSKLDAVMTAAVPMHRVAQAELPSRTAAGLAASVSIPRLISIIVDHAALCARHLLEQLLFAQQGNVQPTARQGTHCVALNVCLLALVQPHVLTQQSTLSLAAPPASLPQNGIQSTWMVVLDR